MKFDNRARLVCPFTRSFCTTLRSRGLAKVPLLGFTASFFVGRTISYSIYLLTTKSIESTNIGEAFRQVIISPFGIALQVAMIVLLVGFTRIDWTKHLNS
jgi:hypothetical protein